MKSIVVSVEEEIGDVTINAPHVVILGAGASRAALPDGDAEGRRLPVMSDLQKIIPLGNAAAELSPELGFEAAYSLLCRDPTKAEVRAKLESAICAYFESLRLPEVTTIYDHLVLSLRPKDVIATFNWDPFLIQAIRRHPILAPARYPQLAFLHGNVVAGYCRTDKTVGTLGTFCRKCGGPYARSSLLYPVTEKNYQDDPMIADGWSFLGRQMKRAFRLTVFGYSAPASDASAMSLLRAGWGTPETRDREYVEIVDIRAEPDLRATWTPFLFSHHYEVHNDFYASSIANHPRRTGESYWNQFVQSRFVTPNAVPRSNDLAFVGEWYRQLIDAERFAERTRSG